MCHALQGHCLPRTAGTQRHCTHLPALWKQEIPKRSKGSAGMQGCCPSSTAGMHGCHPSSTVGTWDTAGMHSCLPSITAEIHSTAYTAGIPPIHHCRGTGHCHGRERAGLPSLHCQHSSTASLALRDTKPPPIQHCRDAGAPSIIPPALHAGHCHPPVALTGRGALPIPVLEGQRLTAHSAAQIPQSGPCASLCTAQPQHTAMAGTASPLCCTVTRQPHTLRQQTLFPSLTADTLFLPIPPTPDWDTAHTCTGCPPHCCRGSGRRSAPLHCRDTHCTRCTAGIQPLETSSQCAHAAEALPATSAPSHRPTAHCLGQCLATSFPVPCFPLSECTSRVQAHPHGFC